MNDIREILKNERLREYDKMKDSLILFRDLIALTIDKYEKKMKEIEEEEIYETFIIKNLTGTIIIFDFPDKEYGKRKSIIIEDYIYKNELTKEELRSPQVIKMYRQKMIEDITEAQMNLEKSGGQMSDFVAQYNENNNQVSVSLGDYREIKGNSNTKKPEWNKKVTRIKTSDLPCGELDAEDITSILGGLPKIKSTKDATPSKKTTKKTTKKSPKKTTKKTTRTSPVKKSTKAKKKRS